jgi:hypothetical protein
MFALPAVDLLKKSVEPTSLRMFALPAVDLLKKAVEPRLKMFALPAVDLFENTIVPDLPEASIAAVAKVCVVPELFVMPAPLMVSVNPGLTVMV